MTARTPLNGGCEQKNRKHNGEWKMDNLFQLAPVHSIKVALALRSVTRRQSNVHRGHVHKELPVTFAGRFVRTYPTSLFHQLLPNTADDIWWKQTVCLRAGVGGDVCE